MEIKNKCVYVFLDHRKKGDYIYGDYKFEYEPIYIGKGNLNRPKQHKYKSDLTRFHNKYQKIFKKTGIEPQYIILEQNLSNRESIEKEIELIKLLKKIEDGGTLCNITNGGEGSSGIVKNKKTIRKFKSSIKKNYDKNLNERKNKFIEKCKNKHNNKYDYSLIDYKNMRSIIKIICPIHGVFQQESHSHQRGSGCPSCSKNKKSNNKIFKKKSNILFNYKYDYSLVDYKNNRTKIKIICPIHGVFEQTPENHLKKFGCLKCSGNEKNTNNTIIEKSIKKHGNIYDYSLVVCNGAHRKIKIICHEHGVFERIARDHYLYGRGCHLCDKLKREKK